MTKINLSFSINKDAKNFGEYLEISASKAMEIMKNFGINCGVDSLTTIKEIFSSKMSDNEKIFAIFFLGGCAGRMLEKIHSTFEYQEIFPIIKKEVEKILNQEKENKK